MPDTIDIWRAAHEIVRWRGTDAEHYVAQKAAEACDENAWAFWLEVERAVTELLAEAAPPDATQHCPIADKKSPRWLCTHGFVGGMVGARPPSLQTR